ncbi:hypothetical protein WME97_04580 [Sorangium sp. So ce367]|uniref:hypothetical protein n=1 Tax=Sorangium sp. So ce367 TaxID=3133305 RepID=UPI003F5E5D57
MTLPRAGMLQGGLLALVLAGSGCGLLLGLDDFDDAPAPGGQGSGGSGGADTCPPDKTEQCYSGLPGTEKVGLCRSGTRTCDSGGETWSACQGEVVPQQESCASSEDENCDGFDCGLWVRTTEAPNNKSRINSIAIDNQGNITIAGSFTETIQFGAEPLVGTAQNDPSALDAFIVSLDSAGKHRWSHQFSDPANQEATSACVDGAGNVIVAGVNSGRINLGKDDIGPGVFVAKFDSSGTHAWSSGIEGSPVGDSGFLAGAPKVACTPDGDVILAGHFAGTLQLGETEFTTHPADAYDIYVARLDGDTGSSNTTDGGWVQRFTSQGHDTLAGVAVHSNNSIVITGNFAQRIEFGNLSPTTAKGMFLTHLDRTGKPTWVRGFANAEPTALAIDTLGNISATGAYEHPTNFGGGDLPEWSQMAFAAQFNIAGNHRWSRGFIGGIKTSSISTDASNDLLILATVMHDVTIDENEIIYVSEFPSPMTIKLAPEGRTVWRKWFPVQPLGVGEARAAATDPKGESVISGRGIDSAGQGANIDFGAAPQPIGDHSLFIAKLGK